MATTAHLGILRGDSKTYEVTVKDTAGNVVNITGYDAQFTVRVQPLDSTGIITKTVGGGGIVLSDPTNGKLQVSLTSSDTTQDVGKYHWDLQVTDTGSDILTVLRGNFNISSDVSR